MEKINILEVALDNRKKDELFQNWLKKIHAPENSGYVCFCDANLCVRASLEPEIKRCLDQAAYILPDGVAMTAGARCLGQKFFERQPGPDMMVNFCKFGVKYGVRHFFYGGKDEEQLQQMLTKLKALTGDIQIAGWYIPPFRSLAQHEEVQLIEQINASNADVIWVGLGAPKQEFWMNAHHKILKVKLAFGVGAAFDFIAGNRQRAPLWIRKFGCEWIFRMFTGGRRVFWRNLKQESCFVFLILKQTIKKRFF